MKNIAAIELEQVTGGIAGSVAGSVTRGEFPPVRKPPPRFGKVFDGNGKIFDGYGKLLDGNGKLPWLNKD